MVRRIFLIAGWLFPVVVLVLFAVKGRFYDPAVFTPPNAGVSAVFFFARSPGWVKAIIPD